VTEIEESDVGTFKVVAEEYNGVVTSAPPATAQPISNDPVNTNAPPGSVNTPIIFEPPSTLAGATPQVWIAASGGVN
jgi:hypothetical protein